MIRVVIVEDELLVRLGTKLCLDGWNNSIRVIEDFENGEEALAYFQNNTADVLISDIRLTGMSGLELIRQVKPDHMQMRTIILSCYEDFSYAKESIELGVDKYMLKHELIGEDLPRAVMELRLEPSVRKEEADTHRFPEMLSEKEASAFMLGYLVLRGEQDPRNSGSSQLDLNILVEIVQKLLNAGGLGECFLRHEEEVFLIFTLEKGMEREEFLEKLRNFYQRLNRNIFNLFNKHTYLFLSDFYVSLSDTRKIFQEVKNLSVYAFYYTDSRLSEASVLKERAGTCPRLDFEKNGLFSSGWFEENRRRIQTFFLEAKKNMADVGQVKAEAVKYFYALAGCQEHVLSRNYSSIDAFDSVVHLENWLLELLDEIKEYLKKERPGSESEREKLEAYIQEHYREEIGLEQAAAAFHMSMPYFCQYFKRNMGMSFVSRVNTVRIQKAQELLRETELSAEQVADSIGISNPNYFVRLFKKLTGQTVGAYRKSLKL